jgi:hypothetical protein
MWYSSERYQVSAVAEHAEHTKGYAAIYNYEGTTK